MSISIQQVQSSLIGLGHGGSLNKIRNFFDLCFRVQNTILSKIDPVDTQRIAPLSLLVHGSLYDYALPSDYKKAIDLYPEGERTTRDTSKRVYPVNFDLHKAFANKQISIEGNEGQKYLRVNWKNRAAQVLNSMDSLTANGAWAIVGTASGLKLDQIYKTRGAGSIQFDVAADGDGIQNSTMTQVDLTDEDEIADMLFDFFIPSQAALNALTSITAIWGNNLTTALWTGVAQTTQADGTGFRLGWNSVKVPWSTATETGTVAPASIDSLKFTIVRTTAIADLRIDNVRFSIGLPFDVKYYSKYIFRAEDTGAWIMQPDSEDDLLVFDDPISQNIFIYECLMEMAQQMEGEDSNFDISYAKAKLNGNPDSPDPVEQMGLYGRYRAEYPSASKKAVTSYNGGPRFPNRYPRFRR